MCVEREMQGDTVALDFWELSKAGSTTAPEHPPHRKPPRPERSCWRSQTPTRSGEVSWGTVKTHRAASVVIPQDPEDAATNRASISRTGRSYSGSGWESLWSEREYQTTRT